MPFGEIVLRNGTSSKRKREFKTLRAAHRSLDGVLQKVIATNGAATAEVSPPHGRYEAAEAEAEGAGWKDQAGEGHEGGDRKGEGACEAVALPDEG
jgi:hypothetical protein